MYMTLVPAYGRDYRTKKEVQQAWSEGKDFQVADLFSPDDGRKVNKDDAPHNAVINIRFRGLSQICQIKTPW